MEAFRSGRYLAFRVGRREFAIEAGPVTAVIPAHDLVSAEHPDPAWLAGESRLRGEPFPVIDLRLRLHLRHGITGRTPCIVVVSTVCPDADAWRFRASVPCTEPRPSGSGQPPVSLIGFRADSVFDVSTVGPHADAWRFRADVLSTEPRPSGSGQPPGSLIGFLADSVSDVIHARAHDFHNGKIHIGRPREVVPLS